MPSPFKVISTDITTTYAIALGDRVYLKQDASVLTASFAFEAAHDGKASLFIHGEVASFSSALNLGLTASTRIPQVKGRFHAFDDE